jgi:glucose 1-dehydrogenase
MSKFCWRQPKLITAASKLGLPRRTLAIPSIADEATVPKGRSGWVPTPLLRRVAVITGSSSGIGKGIALEMAHAGSDVCINYYSASPADDAAAEDVARQVREIGRRAIIYAADVSDRAALEGMFDEAEAQLGPVDVLVTNAITSTRSNILETRADDFEKTLKIGIFGVFHALQIFSRRLIARGQAATGAKGAAVHICSPHTKGPFKESLDYNVAKAGAHHLVLSTANELMWSGIRVNIVQPGWTYTEGELRLYSEEVLQQAAKEMPLRRLCMPEDIGKAAVWLCSEEASYVTGACITVDGGQFIETAPSWKTTGRHGES